MKLFSVLVVWLSHLVYSLRGISVAYAAAQGIRSVANPPEVMAAKTIHYRLNQRKNFPSSS